VALAGLLLVALAIRAAFAAAVVFPPLDDPAYYLQVARNLCHGEGFHIAVIWSHLFPFASVDHPSGELWMPLTSIAICGSWLLFGEGWRTAQLPSVLVGALLPPLTYLLGVRLPAYQAATADSSALFAALITLALLVLAWRPPSAQLVPWSNHQRSTSEWAPYILAGVLAGLAYLTRSYGLALVGCWAAGWWWRRTRGQASLGEACTLLGAFLVVILPWSVRSWILFGSVSPPLAGIAPFLIYPDGFGALPPASGPASLLAHPGEAVGVRLAAAWHGLHGALDLMLLPASLPAWAGVLGLALRLPAGRLAAGYAAALYVGTVLLAPVPALTGSYFHSMGSGAPILALGYAQAVRWLAARLAGWRRWPRAPFWPLWLGVLALAALQGGIAWVGVAERHSQEAAQFAAIRDWLAVQPDAPDGVVMTTQAATLHYAAGRPAIALPVREPVDSVARTMRRYGARYLVITQPDGPYPDAVRAAAEFEPVWRSGPTEIYALRAS
jgi:hypothetical protein